MRIVIDLQGAQTENRFRGIGRYSLAIALEIVKNKGSHEVWLLLNGAFPESIVKIRNAFDGLIPHEQIAIFEVPLPVNESTLANTFRTRAAEKIREYFIEQLNPDFLLITSLFEGYVDNAVTSIGSFSSTIKTAVILYDIIPLIYPELYLYDFDVEEYYHRKILSLKNADLLLAISNYSRLEALEYLKIDQSKVVTISTGLSTELMLYHYSSLDLIKLQKQYNITRKIVLYVPSGVDRRKNIDTLITAYSQLSTQLRAAYQLVIVNSVNDQFSNLAENVGLKADELILTHHVTDHELYMLYSSATLFVFPSIHEGFALSVLEALAYGIPVIGSNRTSIPEVIGLEEALFDPFSPKSIANKIEQALSDKAFRHRLAQHGLEQSKKFLWENVAKRALHALETYPTKKFNNLSSSLKKPRLAFLSPLPPAKTGIATYAVELLPVLLNFYEIDLIVAQQDVFLPLSLSKLTRYSIEEFEKNSDNYDRILYHMGNSHFHSHMITLINEYSGVVVLHDFFLSHMLSYEEIHRFMPYFWSNALYNSHGYSALEPFYRRDNTQGIIDNYPCNLEIAANVKNVIVHSKHVKQLAQEYYDDSVSKNWKIIPLVRTPVMKTDSKASRKILNLDRDCFVICSFGFITPNKLNYELVSAFLTSKLALEANSKLILVGQSSGKYHEKLVNLIAQAPISSNVIITGWVDDITYKHYLQVADIGIQLRRQSRGETSAAVLDCMNYGLPVIVNAHGSMAELPHNAVWMLPDRFTQDELIDALNTLWQNPGMRSKLGDAAKHLIETTHAPAICALKYREAIEAAYDNKKHNLTALIQSITQLPNLPKSDGELKELACFIEWATPKKLMQRELLVDISTICSNDLHTGIERVVRAEVLELIKNPPKGYRVEPVQLVNIDGVWHYIYARKFTSQLLGIPIYILSNSMVNPCYGDIFYGLGGTITDIIQASKDGLFLKWQALGVSLNIKIHDILPILNPEFFPPGMDIVFTAWLTEVTLFADRIIAVSQTVADELNAWLKKNSSRRYSSLKISYSYSGANLEASLPTKEINKNIKQLLNQLDKMKSFLIVGTIEPRKGHLQTLAAFEKLWEQGNNICLIIIGKEGWVDVLPSQRRTIPTIVNKLTNHVELGKRLFWLNNLSDESLEKIYSRSDCLIAASEGEGFGLPLIEAAQYKLPIIARDLPVFKEIAGEHAFYFHGIEPENLANAIKIWLQLYYNEGQVPDSSKIPWKTWHEVCQSQLLPLLINDCLK